MSTVWLPAEQRVVLDQVSWSTYLALLEDVNGQSGRLTYDRGVLEIMAPSPAHETTKRLIGRMVEAYTEELRVDIRSVSAATFKREDLQRGIESDECYYIEHAGAVRGKDVIDLALDPPPDLAIEVDISRSSTDKLGIYSALQVAELWRYDGQRVRMYSLGEDDRYVELAKSRVLPDFPTQEMTRLLSLWREVGETELIRSFRSWVRDQIMQNGSSRPVPD